MLLLTLFLTFIVAGSADAEEGLTLGVHPFLSAIELVDRFDPLTKYLSEKTGMPVSLYISSSYAEHIDMIGRDELDIAFMGPVSYVKMVNKYGNKPILARIENNGSPTFQGVIIVAKDSNIKKLSDLAGKSFAFGDMSSTMSHLVPRYMLWKAGIDVEELKEYKFLKNHNNVAFSVLMGDFEAGAVKEEVFYEYENRGLLALERTPAISEHVFVASSKLKPEIVETIREALYGLRDSKEGIAAMVRIKKDMTAMVTSTDNDYENLREILDALKKIGVNID